MNFNVVIPTFDNNKFNIKDFNAVDGGYISNTKAIQSCIDEATKVGGMVIIPNGIWLTGAISLKSNVNLHLESGAVLLFSKNKDEYPIIKTDFEGVKRLRATSPINAYEANNIAITGKGMINGNGHLWRPIKSFKITTKAWEERLKESSYVVSNGSEGGIWYPSKTSYEGSLKKEVSYDDPNWFNKASENYDFYRPAMINFVKCNNILIEDVTLENSPAWNFHPLFCTNLTLRNAIIKNPEYAQNGDGIDLESCRYVEIYNTLFEVGDDGICLKSGKNAEARMIKVPTEDVYIHDCIVSHAHGGIVVGSEMSRGLRNILVENCTFVGTDIGIRFKSAIGRGGVVEDIDINNIKMLDIKNEAMIFTMGYKLFTMSNTYEENKIENMEDIPEFKNIRMNNISCNGAKIAIKVEGLAELPIHDITLSNSNIVAKRGYDIINGSNIKFNNVKLIDQANYENVITLNESIDEGVLNF